MTLPTTSIVIRTLNEAEHLDALFDSIDLQSQPPDEVVLVDSGSTDHTVAIAESRGASIVHIPPGEFTFGREHTTDHALFVDEDGRCEDTRFRDQSPTSHGCP